MRHVSRIYFDRNLKRASDNATIVLGNARVNALDRLRPAQASA
jgi:hypothetical protein